MKYYHRTLLLLLLGAALHVQAQSVYTEPPVHPDRNKKYLFYFHGRFLENNPLEAAHPEYGPVEYEKIKEAFRSKGFVVITEKRSKDTDVEQYARKIVAQITGLISSGVPAQNITVVGGSKGSYIAQWTSTFLKNKSVNFSLLAGCDGSDPNKPDIHLYGNILSIYEVSDSLGQSCDYLKNADGVGQFKEVMVSLGVKHKIVFQAYPAWVDPTIAWANQFAVVQEKGVKILDTELSAPQLLQKVKKGNAYLIDVRTPEEYKEGHLRYATLIDFKAEDFQKEISKLDKKKPVYLYCRSGNRSGKAKLLLQEWGFASPHNIGGFIDLSNEGLPVAP